MQNRDEYRKSDETAATEKQCRLVALCGARTFQVPFYGHLKTQTMCLLYVYIDQVCFCCLCYYVRHIYTENKSIFVPPYGGGHTHGICFTN